ncbi:MAG: hypothetical protein LBT62_02965, partial [Deltaproteobacteria bacterium]|nr:hypothetical protein [Deltaproteobacteria bacterium]
VWYFVLRDKPEVAPEQSSPVQEEQTPPVEEDSAELTPPEEPTPPVEDDAAELTPPEVPTPPVEQDAEKLPPLQEARKLIQEGADSEQVQEALERFENDPGAMEAVFLLASHLAKTDPKYHVNVGSFYDPLDANPLVAGPKNAMYAYQEYLAAGDDPQAKSRIDALKAWVITPQASQVQGAEELRKALGL